jgi:hypothetical protein
MSFNFKTLADANRAQIEKAAQRVLMGWDKIKKPGANPQETKQVEPQVAETKPLAKKKTTRKAK